MTSASSNSLLPDEIAIMRLLSTTAWYHIVSNIVSGASVSGPYQRRDLSNCCAGMLHVANESGVLSVKSSEISKLEIRKLLCIHSPTRVR